jgi:hypothetical protein
MACKLEGTERAEVNEEPADELLNSTLVVPPWEGPQGASGIRVQRDR